MSRSHRKWVVGVAAAAGLLLLFGKSGTIVAQPGGGVSDWVKVGPYRINGNKIVYTLDEQNSLVIHFGSAAAQDRIVLRGAEAAAMRRWLDARANDPMNAGKTPAPPPASAP